MVWCDPAGQSRCGGALDRRRLCPKSVGPLCSLRVAKFHAIESAGSAVRRWLRHGLTFKVASRSWRPLEQQIKVKSGQDQRKSEEKQLDSIDAMMRSLWSGLAGSSKGLGSASSSRKRCVLDWIICNFKDRCQCCNRFHIPPSHFSVWVSSAGCSSGTPVVMNGSR